MRGLCLGGLRGRRWLVCCAAAAAVVSLAFVSPAVSQQSGSQQQVDPTVAWYAKEYSVSTAEAQRRFGRMPELTRMMGDIRTAEGSRVAGWGFSHTPVFGAWVELVGDAHASEFSLSYHYRVSDLEVRTGAAHSLAELLSEQADFGSQNDPSDSDKNASAIKSGELHKRNMYDAVSFTSIDFGSNALVVGIDPHLITAGLPAEGASGVQAAGASAMSRAHDIDLAVYHATQQFEDHVDTAFKVVDGRDHGHTALLYGGQSMNHGEYVCTAGFVAYDYVGVKKRYGIITAAHCESDKYTQHTVELTRTTVAWTATADVAFYTIPEGKSHTVTGKILCNVNGLTEVGCKITDKKKARYDMSYDEPVCHWGRYTHYTCGTIQSVHHQPQSCTKQKKKCRSVFVSVYGKSLKGCFGDSGGPFFRKDIKSGKNIAYGILSGGGPKPKDCYAGNKTMYFTAIDEAEAHLGVSLHIGGTVTVE